MPDVPAADHGFALFGPDFGVPLGGFCVSVFLVARRDGRALVGRMAEDPVWAREWQPNVRYYDGDRYKALFQGLRFPGTYLREGEHPEAAARRVWRDQLGFADPLTLGSPRIVSEAGASRRRPDRKHWDLLFLYEVAGPELPAARPRHWASLAYREAGELAADDFAMLHGELLPLVA